MRCSLGAVLLASLLPFVHSQASTASGANPMPLPSLATIITGTADSQVVTETFVPHIFTEYTTLTATITTTTILTAGGSPVTIVVGPAGVGWAPYREPSGVPELIPPSVLPPSDVASKDSVNSTTANVVSSSSTPLTSSSSSIPRGTGVSSSSASSSGASATSTSLRGPVGTGSTFRSVPLGTGVSSSLSSSSSSSSSTRVPIGTGGVSSPLSTYPLGTGSSSASSSSSSSSRISLGTGFSGPSSSSSPSQSGGSTSTSGTSGPSASSSSTTYPVIVPVGYVTTAFNNPAETITTLSVSGQAAAIYSKETFPGLSTITAPQTVQTSVVETDKDGKSSTFIGGIVVGPGGVYWGPPGLPPIPPFPGISPPCIWPFCTGGGGQGGSDPPGDKNPPPPYTPDDPNTPDTNDQKTNEPSDRSTQASSTQGSSASSSASQSSSSSSASSSSSSASCSSRTVTDYFVSCASGTSASCSTYSSSAVSGCSVTAATSTEVSACPLGASASPDPTMAGFDYSGGDYPILNPGYSMDVQWSYTVAEIVETGVIVAANAGPSGSASSSQSTGPVTSTATSSSANPGSTASTLATLTTTNTASTRSSGLASTTSLAPQLCENFADPDNGVAGECQCSSGTSYTTLPLLTGSANQCGYTTLPSPAPTTPPSSNTNPYPFTYTDIEDGNIIACKSSSIGNAGVLYTVCEGDRTTVGTDTGIYDHYTQVVQSASAASAASAAAASAASAAAAIPTADCAFWDEALYWTFEVYNINNWAGDNGDGLHNQENGCGDLTGWSWTTGDNGGDQHAYFNLPFFIKSGCVERAIKSAGGPGGLSCNGEGVGKKRRALKQESENKGLLKTRRFATDVSFSSRRNRNQRRRSLPSEPRSEIELPAIDKRDITIAPKRLSARAEIEKLYEIDSRDLVKRGCLDWLWPGKNIPEEWWCNAVLPGVDACTKEIQKKGVVGKYPSMFYTSWGGIGDGSLGVEGTKLWASQNICGRVVDFDGITVGVYQYIVESAVLKPFGKGGLNLPEDEQKKILDPFLKNLSQAFAEQSSGEAYVFVPKGVDFQPTSAWTGWEYPALTRNDNIEKIWKVELDTSDQSQFVPPNGKPPGVKTLLWSKGDPPTAQEPKGTRAGTLPSQIPQDQIPANWQSSI